MPIDRVGGPGHAGLDDRRAGDHLEDRPGLEAVADRTVAPGRRGKIGVPVWVEARDRRHGQDLAGLRVDRDGARVLGARLLHPRGELLLGDELQVPIEGERERGALLSLPSGDRGQRVLLLPRVARDAHLPFATPDGLVVLELDAGQARSVEAHVPERVAREAVVGVVPAQLRQHPDSRELPALELLRRPIGDLARDPHEALLRGELLGHFGAGDPEGRRELGRFGRDVLDPLRNGEDRGGLHRNRELAPAAVEQRAAPRREEHGALLLLACARAVGVAMQDLDLQQAKRDEPRPRGENRPESDAAARAHRGHRRGSAENE